MMNDFEGIMEFEGLGLCFYIPVGFQKPKKGEFYASGAIPKGYRAPVDLDYEYQVVHPTHKALIKRVYVKGKRVSR